MGSKDRLGKWGGNKVSHIDPVAQKLTVAHKDFKRHAIQSGFSDDFNHHRAIVEPAPVTLHTCLFLIFLP